MPQFDVSEFLPQLVWLAILFTILYVVMSRFALPRVAEVLEERQDRIDADLEEAEKHRKEGSRLEQAYEDLTEAAKAEAVSYLKDERDKVHRALDAKQANFTRDLNARVGEAEKRIGAAKDKAMADLDAVAAEACSSIVSALTGEKMSAANAKKAVRAVKGGK